MKILFLDCAQKTGWALVENGRLLESGVQDLTKKRGESNGLLFLRWRKWLSDLLDLTTANVVGYERAHYRGGAATEICVGLQTRAQELAEERGLESAPVTTAALKRFATGKGNAGKGEVERAAEAILGRPPVTDDEADAVLGAMLLARDLDPDCRTHTEKA